MEKDYAEEDISVAEAIDILEKWDPRDADFWHIMTMVAIIQETLYLEEDYY